MRRLALAALAGLALASGAGVASAQVVVDLRDAGPGVAPAILANALATPHTVVPPAGVTHVISKDTTAETTVIVLGRDVVVEGRVRGDVIVVGGDVYMRPGGRIDGRAIAIGGGVYPSSLAHIMAGTVTFRDFTYDIAPITGGYALSYRALNTPVAPSASLTGLYGIHIPTYDRSDGLSLPFGPQMVVPGTHLQIEPRLTYRSQLGRLDPSVTVRDTLDRRTTLRASFGRSTFTNDAWIWPDLVNTANFFFLGDDTRNYFRAVRGEATLARRVESVAWTLEPYIGARWERAHAVRPGATPTSSPWTMFNRGDSDDAGRPNPSIDDGSIRSVLVGAQLDWVEQSIVARAALHEEIGTFSASATGSPSRTFGQTTFDGSIGFPTFGLQSLRFSGHAVSSSGSTPRQRWAYLGGPGSLPTLELLSRGGDHLFYLDGRYNVPLTGIVLPLLGVPTVSLREVLAGAAAGPTPVLAQGLGPRITAGGVYFEILVDPVGRRAHTGFGLSMGR